MIGYEGKRGHGKTLTMVKLMSYSANVNDLEVINPILPAKMVADRLIVLAGISDKAECDENGKWSDYAHRIASFTAGEIMSLLLQSDIADLSDEYIGKLKTFFVCLLFGKVPDHLKVAAKSGLAAFDVIEQDRQ